MLAKRGNLCYFVNDLKYYPYSTFMLIISEKLLFNFML